jgi:hypothetical protein
MLEPGPVLVDIFELLADKIRTRKAGSDQNSLFRQEKPEERVVEHFENVCACQELEVEEGTKKPMTRGETRQALILYAGDNPESKREAAMGIQEAQLHLAAEDVACLDTFA